MSIREQWASVTKRPRRAERVLVGSHGSHRQSSDTSKEGPGCQKEASGLLTEVRAQSPFTRSTIRLSRVSASISPQACGGCADRAEDAAAYVDTIRAAIIKGL
jgi:hypothetical protein